MFHRDRTGEREMLGPLLALARSRHGYERTVWLAELRADAPTVAARLELLLREETDAVRPVVVEPLPAPDRAMPRAALRWARASSGAPIA